MIFAFRLLVCCPHAAVRRDSSRTHPTPPHPTEFCRSNAVEISAALHDLSAMQRQVAALKQRLGSNNTALQAAGRSFLDHLSGTADMLRVQQGVADTRQVGGAKGAGFVCALRHACFWRV